MLSHTVEWQLTEIGETHQQWNPEKERWEPVDAHLIQQGEKIILHVPYPEDVPAGCATKVWVEEDTSVQSVYTSETVEDASSGLPNGVFTFANESPNYVVQGTVDSTETMLQEGQDTAKSTLFLSTRRIWGMSILNIKRTWAAIGAVGFAVFAVLLAGRWDSSSFGSDYQGVTYVAYGPGDYAGYDPEGNVHIVDCTYKDGQYMVSSDTGLISEEQLPFVQAPVDLIVLPQGGRVVRTGDHIARFDGTGWKVTEAPWLKNQRWVKQRRAELMMGPDGSVIAAARHPEQTGYEVWELQGTSWTGPIMFSNDNPDYGPEAAIDCEYSVSEDVLYTVYREEQICVQAWDLSSGQLREQWELADPTSSSYMPRIFLDIYPDARGFCLLLMQSDYAPPTKGWICDVSGQKEPQWQDLPFTSVSGIGYPFRIPAVMVKMPAGNRAIAWGLSGPEIGVLCQRDGDWVRYGPFRVKDAATLCLRDARAQGPDSLELLATVQNTNGPNAVYAVVRIKAELSNPHASAGADRGHSER